MGEATTVHKQAEGRPGGSAYVQHEGARPAAWVSAKEMDAEAAHYDCLSTDGLRRSDRRGIELRRSDIDMDNLLIKIQGKGRKQRILPFSLEMRKRLYVWLKEHEFDPSISNSAGPNWGSDKCCVTSKSSVGSWALIHFDARCMLPTYSATPNGVKKGN
jgi:hypothetical protein